MKAAKCAVRRNPGDAAIVNGWMGQERTERTEGACSADHIQQGHRQLLSYIKLQALTCDGVLRRRV